MKLILMLPGSPVDCPLESHAITTGLQRMLLLSTQASACGCHQQLFDEPDSCHRTEAGIGQCCQNSQKHVSMTDISHRHYQDSVAERSRYPGQIINGPQMLL